MKFTACLATLAISVFLPRVIAAQNPPPERDAQGIQALTQSVSAAGGVQTISGIQDFTATGNITFNWPQGQGQGTATAYGKGLGEFRMDSSVGGTVSFVVNSSGGQFVDINSKVTPVPFYNLMTAGSFTVPAVRLAEALNDTTVGIIYVGQVTWNNAPAIQVHMTQAVDPSLSSVPGLSALGAFDIFLDPTTYQVVGLSESIWQGTFAQSISHILQFSGYSTFENITVPTTVSETVNSGQTWSLTVTGIQFNTGLPDSLFNF
jgi:hypothetical protein